MSNSRLISVRIIARVHNAKANLSCILFLVVTVSKIHFQLPTSKSLRSTGRLASSESVPPRSVRRQPNKYRFGCMCQFHGQPHWETFQLALL
jgi:hypothetical protein